MERITLFEEYRLVERSDSEVNGAWKGAHLLLFFLAFVFGFFCTFCFHMLIYLFDEKCVLFPKLLSLSTLRQNIIYEFIPEDKEIADMLPVDFLSTQWVEKSACYIPTYVPLVSSIFGLVWTTMFLMCSTGSRPLTGLRRPWRVLLPVFVFSLAMGGLCLYATILTHAGLQELCEKLGEITGGSTCTYSINVATLAYERRIRGVYQATRITILSAWLHTLCWLLSAVLTLIRVLLVVDFQLVKINVELKGNIDKMLERQEQQIRTVSPEAWVNNEKSSRESICSLSSVKVHFQKKEQTSRLVDTSSLENAPTNSEGQVLFRSPFPPSDSEPSLVEDERFKLDRIKAFNSVPKDKQFIVKMLFDLIDMIDTPRLPTTSFTGPDVHEEPSQFRPLIRQYGQQAISSKTAEIRISEDVMESELAEQIAQKIKHKLEKEDRNIIDLRATASTCIKPTEFESLLNITSDMRRSLKGKVASESSKKIPKQASNVSEQIETDEKSKEFDSSLNIPPDMRHSLKRKVASESSKKIHKQASKVSEQTQTDEKLKVKKSNLKNKKVQTREIQKSVSPRVQIKDSKTSVVTYVHESATETKRKPEEITSKKPKKEKTD